MDKGKNYNDFLLAEYNNIAQAHHNSQVTISTFFSYYMIIVSAPFPLIALFKAEHTDPIQALLQYYASGVPVAMLLVSMIGLCVVCYLVNLRLDALLYARTVNGIRDFFLRESGLSPVKEGRVRVLPRATSAPPYFEKMFFLFVVMSMGIVNSVYFALFVLASSHLLQLGFGYKFHGAAIAFIGMFFFHIYLYKWLAQFRETRYLPRRLVIGFDIDGVISKHREHFCNVLFDVRGKRLNADGLTTIPVRNCGQDVSQDDERRVFEEKKYWTEMPIYDHTADYMRMLNSKYEIWIFTSRAAQPIQYPFDITKITEAWLEKFSIPSNRIYASKYEDRFEVCKGEYVHAFVEDDPQKALRLARVCDVVFLFDHPYNQNEQFPANVIRIKSLNEIEAHLAKFEDVSRPYLSISV